jgi:serine/threonine protein kinase
MRASTAWPMVGRVQPGPQLVVRPGELAGDAAHDVGDRDLVAELSEHAAVLRLGRPGRRRRRIGDVGDMDGHAVSTIGRVSTHVGTSLGGRYRLDAQIGHGGMSTVYRAFDTVLERQVAVKLMHRDIAHNPDQLERFRREARAVAQLNHPHIVQVIDAGEDDAMPFIVFEYVEGETLKDRIRRFGYLPIPEALAYAIEIARALSAAHDRGIVHRDVKPQNILVDEEGSGKVTDFGIARTLEQEGLTADGRVLGTTDYVSPEQALGHAVTGSRTSTRSASCCSRCSRATCPSTATTRSPWR